MGQLTLLGGIAVCELRGKHGCGEPSRAIMGRAIDPAEFSEECPGVGQAGLKLLG
jgi:hypothetical protein